MYGWINESLRLFILSNFGEPIWLQLVKESGCKDTDFVRYEYASDEVFYNLLSRTSALLQLEESALLESFGAHFIQLLKKEGLSNLLYCLGANLLEWLSNIDLLHSHISYSLPKIRSPKFSCYVDSAVSGAILLHYKSERGSRMKDLVVGIVREVAESIYKIEVTFELLTLQGIEGAESTCWRIRQIGGTTDSNVIKTENNAFAGLNMGTTSAQLACPFRLAEVGSAVEREWRETCALFSKSKVTSPASDSSRGDEMKPIHSPSGSSSKLIKSSFSSVFGRNRKHMTSPTGSSRKTKLTQTTLKWIGSQLKRHQSSASFDTTNSIDIPEDLPDDVSMAYHISQLGHPHGISGEMLNCLHPYHIVFDKKMNIIQAGTKLQFILKTMLVGKNLVDYFHILNPELDESSDFFEEILSKTFSSDITIAFKLKSASHLEPLQLTGPVFYSASEKTGTILCSPNVLSLSEMLKMGLTATDIPRHDQRLQVMLLAEQFKVEMETTRSTIAGKDGVIKQQKAENKRLQQELANIKSELLTKKNFVRYVSHEIRTPLTVSKIGLDLLAAEMNNFGVSEEFQSNVVDCQQSVEIAVTILNDLLSYEKLESGIMELFCDYVQVVPFVSETFSLFMVQAAQKSIDFTVNFDLNTSDLLPIDSPDQPPGINDMYMNVDKMKISQVFRNLASNALKFTTPGGYVKVLLSCEQSTDDSEVAVLNKNGISRIGTSSPRGVLRKAHSNASDDMSEISERSNHLQYCTYKRCGVLLLKVLDNGAGMLQEDQERVFNEIVQFSPNELQAGGGSGLGLWITKRICDVHGGSISMHSDGLGQGSVFCVRLPLYRCYDPADITAEYDFPADGLEEDHSKQATSSLPASSGGNESVDRLGTSRTHSFNSSSGSKAVKKENVTADFSVIFQDLRVLVVDDSTMVRKVVMKLLKSYGAICIPAEHGQEAIDIISSMQANLEETVDLTSADQFDEDDEEDNVWSTDSGAIYHTCFDVVLMDYIMPVMDGPSATRLLRGGGYNGLIVGATGNMMPYDVEEFQVAGANVVLPKPLDVKDLAKFLYSQGWGDYSI